MIEDQTGQLKSEMADVCREYYHLLQQNSYVHCHSSLCPRNTSPPFAAHPNTSIPSETPQELTVYCNISDNLNYEAKHIDNFA